MRHRDAGSRRALAVLGATGLVIAFATACGSDGRTADRVASESPTVPATTAATAPATPADAVTTVSPSTSTSTSGTPSTTSSVATTEPGGRSTVRLALQAARDRWRVAEVQTYEHQYVVRCDCEPLSATVRVLGGRVLGRVSGQGLEMATVGEWFAAVAGAIDTADAVEVDFDDDLGHPLHVLIDPDDARTGDEYGLDTAALHIVSDPIERWFTASWGCGYQLVASTPDESTALVLRLTDAGIPRAGRKPFDVESLAAAELWFGTDLMAGWCGRAPAPDDPVPVIDTSWAVVDGTVELATERRSASGDARSLVARSPSGTVIALGSATLRNDAWGEAAG
jgi:hypothetical protein